MRAAVALCGNEQRVEVEMPQCRLRVARFRRPDRMEFLDNRQFYGNAFALLVAAEHREYAAGGGSIGVAIYDDRLEVTSPGTLHFGLTPEELFAPYQSRPWNPLIARTFILAGPHRGMGSRHAQDGRGNRVGRPPTPGD